jgi:hypothetical protein
MRKKPVADSQIGPATPVMVEWWVHDRIPSRHYAMVCPYAQALQWYNRGLPVTCWSIDEELLHERDPKTAG